MPVGWYSPTAIPWPPSTQHERSAAEEQAVGDNSYFEDSYDEDYV